MKMADAQKVMDGKPEISGYRVHFERVKGKLLATDYFPDRKEKLIKTEEEAWVLAEMFAKNTVGKCVNIYVCGSDYSPVEGYRESKIENRE